MPRQAPDLSNATPEFLIDEYAKMKLVENQAKFLAKVYKEALYGRTGVNVDNYLNGQATSQAGETFLLTITRSDPNRIDTTKLKEEYPDIAEACTVSKGQLTARPTLKEGATNPKVESLLQQMLQELDLE